MIVSFLLSLQIQERFARCCYSFYSFIGRFWCWSWKGSDSDRNCWWSFCARYCWSDEMWLSGEHYSLS